MHFCETNIKLQDLKCTVIGEMRRGGGTFACLGLWLGNNKLLYRMIVHYNCSLTHVKVDKKFMGYTYSMSSFGVPNKNL